MLLEDCENRARDHFARLTRQQPCGRRREAPPGINEETTAFVIAIGVSNAMDGQEREKKSVYQVLSAEAYDQRRLSAKRLRRCGCGQGCETRWGESGASREKGEERRRHEKDTKWVLLRRRASMYTEGWRTSTSQIDDFTFLELFVRRSFRRGSRSRLDLVHVDPSTIEGADRVASRVDLWADILWVRRQEAMNQRGLTIGRVVLTRV